MALDVLMVVVAGKLPLLQLVRAGPLLWPLSICCTRARELPRLCDTLGKVASLFGFWLREIVAADIEARQRSERNLRFVPDQLSATDQRQRSFVAPALTALSL